jgi:hypothetical protein
MFAHPRFQGSAVVSTAVFGVPPNALLRRLFLNQNVLDRLFIEIIKAGCGKVALPGFTENVDEPQLLLVRYSHWNHFLAASPEPPRNL